LNEFTLQKPFSGKLRDNTYHHGRAKSLKCSTFCGKILGVTAFCCARLSDRLYLYLPLADVLLAPFADAEFGNSLRRTFTESHDKIHRLGTEEKKNPGKVLPGISSWD
jgi:hypothetical protein